MFTLQHTCWQQITIVMLPNTPPPFVPPNDPLPSHHVPISSAIIIFVCHAKTATKQEQQITIGKTTK